MVRNYKRKPKRVTEEDWVKMFEEVAEGASVNSTAKKYGLNESTLRSRIKAAERDGSKRKHGGLQCLPRDIVDKLAVIITTRSKWGFASTRDEIKDLVQEYVTAHREADTPLGEYLKKHCFFKNNRP